MVEADGHDGAIDGAALYLQSPGFRMHLEITAARDVDHVHKLPEKDWGKYDKAMCLTFLGLAR